MSQILHDIEKKIIDSLQKKSEQTPEQLSESTELSIDQVRRGIEWLRLKEFANVIESSKVTVSLGRNGIDSLKNGLPERKLMDLIKDGSKSFEEIRKLCQELVLMQQLQMPKKMVGSILRKRIQAQQYQQKKNQ